MTRQEFTGLRRSKRDSSARPKERTKKRSEEESNVLYVEADWRVHPDAKVDSRSWIAVSLPTFDMHSSVLRSLAVLTHQPPPPRGERKEIRSLRVIVVCRLLACLD
ncbi:hypothetical protein ALC60_04442 [Trachymyrmex zeteki]|uniref:Uncharacterized protein n=1 Tax=Mycetomoellerius zeteki TaxID=64791 RepID=A0A151X884_9HYME|nr:hypothetical protein ALC60_04442 [Trachymyrmex zeteki]